MCKARILAESNGSNRFDIYLCLSGARHYLMSHRQNDHLFQLLKGGVSIDELDRTAQKKVTDISANGFYRGTPDRRKKCRKNQSRKLENSVGHLLSVVQEYMLYEAA